MTDITSSNAALVNGIDQINLDRTTEIPRPTLEAHNECQVAFDFLNQKLFKPTFGVELPNVMLNLPYSARYLGVFIPDLWVKSSDEAKKYSSIGLNLHALVDDLQILQVLAHEAVHLGQEVYPDAFGKPCKNGWHGNSFAKAMNKIGLIVSSTGKPGGKTTGYRMSDYVLPGGLFEAVFDDFKQAGHQFSWCIRLGQQGPISEPDDISLDLDRTTDKVKERKRRSKTKYTCDNCQINAWAKPGVRLNCGACDVALIEAAQ